MSRRAVTGKGRREGREPRVGGRGAGTAAEVEWRANRDAARGSGGADDGRG